MTSTTNFEKVQEFNTVFEAECISSPDPKVLYNTKLMNLRVGLIKEEVKELEDAVETKDYIETIDALADILYVVYGMGDAIGVDLDKAFQIVQDSNMSKLCNTEEEAKETVDWYLNNNTDYDSPSYRKSKCGRYYIVFNKSTNKILKSINYTPAKFDTIL